MWHGISSCTSTLRSSSTEAPIHAQKSLSTGNPSPSNPDGSFRYHFIFPDGVYEIPIVAISPDGVRIPVRRLALSARHAKIRESRRHHTAPARPSNGFRLLKDKPRPARKKQRGTATDDVLAGKFLLYLEGEKNASPHTQTSYRIALEAFQRFRPGLSWRSATADDFRAFLFHLMKSGSARSSIRLLFSALRSFYHFLVIRKILDSNVIKTLDIPKKEKQLPKFLTHSQMETFLERPEKSVRQKQAPAWMASRDEAIFELFYSSGLRLSRIGEVGGQRS